MFGLLFDVFNWEKLTFSKLLNSFEKVLNSKKIQGIFAETFIFSLLFSTSFVYKIASQISFNLFYSGDKRLFSEFLRKWGWFQGHSKLFLKYLD